MISLFLLQCQWALKAAAKGSWLEIHKQGVRYRAAEIFEALPKSLLTEFGIFHGLKSCVWIYLWTSRGNHYLLTHTKEALIANLGKKRSEEGRECPFYSLFWKRRLSGYSGSRNRRFFRTHKIQKFFPRSLLLTEGKTCKMRKVKSRSPHQ